MVTAIWLGVSSAHAIASANSDSKEYMFYLMGPHSRPSDLQSAPHMQVGEDAAPWLPRVLDRLKKVRGPHYNLLQVALFYGDGGQQYLALTWKFSWSNTVGILEFHRVDIGNDDRVHLTILRELRDRLIWLVWPSGEGVFPGEPTVAVAIFGSGGSGSEGYGYRFIQMKRNTVDITPDAFGRTADLADVDGDGVFEAVVEDQRWKASFDSRGVAGPHVPVILERQAEMFVPACKEHAEIFLRDIGRSLDALAENDRWPYEDQLQIMLDHLQLGQLTQAWADYDQLLEYLDRVDSKYLPTRAEMAAKLLPVLRAARSVLDEPCVLNALPAEAVRTGERIHPLAYRYDNWVPRETDSD
jgi:hypothetical protein